MLNNNVEIDVKTMCMKKGVTQAQLTEKMGTSAPYVNRVLKNHERVVNKTFISMMENLGYDIEITYVKKRGDSK